ncbi:hypothetical protein LTR78_006316 [Recurvomyces mirabilis]|uniref:GED domain-containing protein n=1 Tax=Recurvomyces mirabilis TaxID=574656 RepID=A0AAE1C082_9PEZI|nr:hypothetical protein LTR78_006316 [Recurvomyces mirabilis]KAK5152205.1 hypothetical protein LTS14_008580 [Recurvomyces mirabilis]
MNQSAAEDALDSQLAYYKDEVKIFIANTTKQVVERHLLAELPEDTLSPLMINDMSDQEVGYLAGEAEETTHKRVSSWAGQDAFKKALGSYK